MNKRHVLVLDETNARVGICGNSTLVAEGESSYVLVEENSSYAHRYDMIACCSIDRVFPPIIYSPEDRKDLGVDGVKTFMLEQYIHSILAQAVASLDRYPLTLVLDKANVHNVDKIKQAFIDGGCQDVAEVIVLPTQAAKRVSPLDNAMFNTWKSKVKQHEPITSSKIVQVMADAWNELDANDIQPNYHHCLLMQRQDVYADCPDPASHKHNA